MPVRASSPAQQGHSLDTQATPDPLDNGSNVSHDLRRARQRRVLLGRLLHFWWSGRVAIAASIHHIDDISMTRQISSKRAIGYIEVKRGDSRDARSMKEKDRPLLLVLRLAI